MNPLMRALSDDMAAIFSGTSPVSDQARALIDWDHRFAHMQGAHPDAAAWNTAATRVTTRKATAWPSAKRAAS